MNDATRFGVIRHARTTWNNAKRIQGRTETPLSDAGIQEARLWGRGLAPWGWDRILTSGMGRARHTAELLNESFGGLPVEHDARLIELEWGRWTGLYTRDLYEAEADETRRLESMGWDFRAPGGESRLEALERSLAAMRDAAQRHPGDRILVVTHMGILKCLLYHLLAMDFLPEEPVPLRHYRMHMIACANGGFTLESRNNPILPDKDL